MLKNLRLTSTKLFAASIIITLSIVAGVSAAHYWQAAINTPYAATGGFTNKTTANVEYKVLSTSNDSNDEYSIDVKQNGKVVHSGIIAAGGDSGQIAVNLPNDGEYDLQIVATSTLDSSSKSSKTVTVTRDTVAPDAPEYGESTQSGSNFEVTFEAPTDASQAIIYSSKNSTFTANSQTEVGRIDVSSTQSQSFSYTASDSDERFHAVQVVDRAGNASPLVGDSETVIENQTEFTPAPSTAEGTTDTGQTAPAVATTADGDQADTLGTQDDPDNEADSDSESVDVLGVEDPADDENTGESSLLDRLTNPLAIVAILLALGGTAYYLMSRGKFRNRTKN